MILLRTFVGASVLIFVSEIGLSYSANKVWFEFLKSGRYRVFVNYTIPEIKEYRELYVDFRKKSEADKFYFDLLRGADFFPPDPKNRTFQDRPAEPSPW